MPVLIIYQYWILRCALELKFKGKISWDVPEQDGSARY
jgi:hypothetical protein